MHRTVPGIGLIRRASGTRSPLVLGQVVQAIEWLSHYGEIEILAAVRDGRTKPVHLLGAHGMTGMPRKPRRGSSTQMYIVQAAYSRAIKVGIARDVAARLCALQTGNHEPLILLWSGKGGLAEERAIHARLKAHRTGGEWFRFTPEVCRWVKRRVAA